MPTINELKVERRSAYTGLKREVKAMDTAIEKLQRQIERVLARKNKVPESLDLDNSTILMRDLNNLMLQTARYLTEMERIFRI